MTESPSVAVDPPRPAERSVAVAFASIVAIGVALRLAWLFQPIRYDEAVTFLVYAEAGFRASATQYTAPNNHVLHTLLVHVCTLWTKSEWAVRLPAFVAGVTLVPLTAWAGLRFAGREAALFGAALVACSGHLIEYATNARGYSLVGVFTLLQILAADRIVRTARDRDCLVFAASTALGLFTVPTMVYPTAVTLAWAALIAVIGRHETPWRRLAWRTPAYAALCVALVGTLYAPVMLRPDGWRNLTGNRWVEPLHSFGRWRQALAALGRGLAAEWSLGLTGPGLVGVIVLAIIGMTAGVAARRDVRLAWFAVALVVSLAVMAAQRVVPFVRVFGFALPMLLLAAGAGLAAALRFAMPRLGHGPTAAAVLCVGLGAYVALARVPDRAAAFDKFPAAKGVVAFLAPHVDDDGDAVLFGEVPSAPAWYERHRTGRPAMAYRAGARRLWVVTQADQSPMAVLLAAYLPAASPIPADAFGPPRLAYDRDGGRIYELVPLNHRTPRLPRRMAKAGSLQ